MTTSTFSNVCAADCYGACRIKTTCEQGRIIQITGDPSDPYTRGALCAKGYTLIERTYSASRILYPMKQSPKGSGQWHRITWDQAFTEIAERLIRIEEQEQSLLPVCLDKYLGSVGILNRTVEGFFRSIGPVTVMSGSPCEPAGAEALRLSYGARRKSVPEDMLNAKLILIWGCNPAWTAPHQMRYIYEARERGAELVVIDPILTATAARADYYVQIRPGTDGLLALGMAKVLVEEDMVNHAFLQSHTHGFEAFRRMLSTVDLGAVSTATGVPTADVVRLARLYAGRKPATIWLGIGAQHAPAGGQNYRAIDALAALTGNIGIPGGNVHYGTDEAWAYAREYEQLPPPASRTATGPRKIGTGRYGELSSLTPPVRFLWVAGRNPVSQNPDSSLITRTLRSLETVVVADQFMTATAAMADYVLPVASFFEYEDVVIAHWHYGAAVNQQAIEPPGECRSDLEIMRGLAATLNRLKPGFSTFPVERTAEAWLDAEMKPRLYPLLGITHFRELLQGYHRVNLPSVAWADRQFLTPSGKYEFLAGRALEHGLPPLPAPISPDDAPEAYPYLLLTVRSFAVLNSQFRDDPRLLEVEPGGRLFLHPDTARAKGVADGDAVHVYNMLGELSLTASLTAAVQPDLLVVHVGDASPAGDQLNSLISLREADLGHLSSGFRGLSFGHIHVNFAKVEGR